MTAPSSSPPPLNLPDLPPYPGLPLERVQLCATREAVEAALPRLLAADALGFDTESKPTFRKGEESTGPHLLQLAEADQAWLFPLAGPAGRELAPLLQPLLEAEHVLKVGFDLKSDEKRLAAKFGIRIAGVVDLAVALRGLHRHDLGAKTAVAQFFGQALRKSKKISTTNWARLPYTPAQMLYAANDAQVALAVYREWLRRKAAMAQRPGIALIGMPGAGKSTVGRWLAKRLGWALVDTDRLIEERAGRKLQQIIDDEGVARLLELENQVLYSLPPEAAIFSTGGSAVYCSDGMTHLGTIAAVIHLHCELPELVKRIRDPAARGIVMAPGQTLESLYEERNALYRKYADLRIDASRSPATVGEAIIRQTQDRSTE